MKDNQTTNVIHISTWRTAREAPPAPAAIAPRPMRSMDDVLADRWQRASAFLARLWGRLSVLLRRERQPPAALDAAERQQGVVILYPERPAIDDGSKGIC